MRGLVAPVLYEYDAKRGREPMYYAIPVVLMSYGRHLKPF